MPLSLREHLNQINPTVLTPLQTPSHGQLGNESRSGRPIVHPLPRQRRGAAAAAPSRQGEDTAACTGHRTGCPPRISHIQQARATRLTCVDGHPYSALDDLGANLLTPNGRHGTPTCVLPNTPCILPDETSLRHARLPQKMARASSGVPNIPSYSSRNPPIGARNDRGHRGFMPQ